MHQKLLGSLGLIAKARKLIYGKMLFDMITQGKIRVVIIANDMSDKQKNNLVNKCKNNEVPYHEINDLTSAELSFSIGRHNVKAVGVTDANFAKLIKNTF